MDKLESLNNLKVSKEEESKIQDISVELKELECPFSWNFDLKYDIQPITSKIEDKLSVILDEDVELTLWKMFVWNIILCYEYGKVGNFDESMEKLQDCELKLAQQKECSATALVMGHNGLEHILLACKCHLLSVKSKKEEVNVIFPKITLVSAMTDEDKACVYCMKGAFCAEYGYDGVIKSIEFIEKGLSINDKCPEWHFLLGRSLGRIRRFERRAELPEQRELEALENAAKLSDNAGFHILLADAYRETARNICLMKPIHTSDIKSLVDTLNKKAYDLIRKVILNKSRVHLNARCAAGLIKLPRPWQDLDLAKDCLLKDIDIAPNNPMVNHVAGIYYNCVKDYKRALNYFAKAAAMGVYGAEMDAVVLKKRMNMNYDPSADLLRCLKTYTDKPRIINTLCYLGSYFYSRKNVQKALEYWIQATEIDIQSHKLQYKPDRRILDINLPINEIILMELFKLLKNKNTSEEEKVKYQDLISKYRKHLPDTVEKVEKMELRVR